MNDVICIREPWQFAILLVFVMGLISGFCYRYIYEQIKKVIKEIRNA